MEGLLPDILRIIFSNLKVDEIRQCFRVCKSFYMATQNQKFWIDLWCRFNSADIIKKGDVYMSYKEIRDLLFAEFRLSYKRINLEKVKCDECSVINIPKTEISYKKYPIKYTTPFKDFDPYTITVKTPLIKYLRVRADVDFLSVGGKYEDKDFSYFLKKLDFLCKKLSGYKSKNRIEGFFSAKPSKHCAVFYNGKSTSLEKVTGVRFLTGYMLVSIGNIIEIKGKSVVRFFATHIELYSSEKP